MKNHIENALNEAMATLIRCDSDILFNDINERSISHRLATYIEPLFPGWNVDCEYNRNHEDSKRLDIDPKRVLSDNTNAPTVYPDIIIHKRGTDANLLVIEMKKTSSQESDDYDYRKLEAFKKQLKYHFAVFIKVKTNGQAGIENVDWV